MTIRLEKSAPDLSYELFLAYFRNTMNHYLNKKAEIRPKKRQDDKLRVDIGKKEKACAVTKALDV
jgi:hypothetical protein